MSVPSRGYNYYDVVKGVMLVILKWKLYDLKVVYKREDHEACLLSLDQSCDNSKINSTNKIMTFSPVLISR